MEVGGDNKFNIELETGPVANVYQPQSPLLEPTHVSTYNNHLEAHSHVADNNQTHVTSLPTSSQNPFLVPTEATNGDVKDDTNDNSSDTHISNSSDEIHSLTNDPSNHHSPNTPSTCESSQENLFHEKTNINENDSSGAFESSEKQPSSSNDVPTNDESHHPSEEIDKGQQSVDSTIHLGTLSSSTPKPLNQEQNHASLNASDNATPNSGLASDMVRESNDDVTPIISMPNHKHSDDVAGQHFTSSSPGQNIEHRINKGPEIQNPPIQTMERTNEFGAASQYVFPSHVFARNNTNAPVEWSTASNESLFSIYMGNMSFSNELTCFKSCELDKPGDVYTPDQPNVSPNHQPLTPVNKFNDISQRTAELHEEGLKVTEAKAAETMREVIMESSRTTENVGKKEDKKSNSRHQSDGSTGSYAFQTSKDRDKSVSSKGAGENQTSHKKPEQNEKTKAVDQTPKSNTNASPNKWLNCLSCCTFCH